MKYLGLNSVFGFLSYLVTSSSLEATLGMSLMSVIGISWVSFNYFMIPFLVQSIRRTVPLIIFDDLNKI